MVHDLLELRIFFVVVSDNPCSGLDVVVHPDSIRKSKSDASVRSADTK